MSTLSFARIFSDGAVLQRKKKIHIWGFANKGTEVAVSFAGKCEKAVADENGRFDVFFPPMEKGGPYTLSAESPCDGRIESKDIMIGDVILISGQSNMEFPMSRVKETYPSEWQGGFDSMIRNFKVAENGVFMGVLADVMTGEWKEPGPDALDDFSAVGYFTAKHLRLAEDAPVGIVDITLGGAPIEAFMSNEMLTGYDEAIREAKKFSNDEFRKKTLESNEKNAMEWRRYLDANDIGTWEHYETGEEVLKNGRDFVIPEYFSDTELEGFIGSIWMARTFSVPDEYAGKSARLFFGTITDYDFCYLNGQFIGTTDYCYPPRRYDIPEGLIKPGKNTIVFRICVEKGYGRITPGKLYGIVFGDGIRTTDGFNEGFSGADHIEPLAGVWKYLVGGKCDASPDTVFVNWMPTALYNGMLGPLAGFHLRAFAFYQGESNCGRADEYADLTERFVSAVRKLWDDDMPYICVQLPEFNARNEEISYDHGKGWRALSKAQEECQGISGFKLVRSYGTGELNDIHPERKEPIGEMIAQAILADG